MQDRARKALMTEGVIWKILVRFALPLFLGALFQQLYNAVDGWVVGRYVGDDALAAVTSSGSLMHFLIGFFQGVFVGASVIISSRYGARDPEGVDRAIHTTVIFAVVMGILLTVFGVLFTPTILTWMGVPANVMPQSVEYFRIYCFGLLALVLYNTSNGIFQALGDSFHPLVYLIVSSVTNVVLDILFVVVFRWGVAGAAFATVLGQLLSAFLGFLHLASGRFIVRIRLSHLKFHADVFRRVVKIGLPSGVQNSVISLANIVVQSNINAFGDVAMAGCGSFSKIEGFAFLPIMSITMAMTTFIGQNLGAGCSGRARAGAKIGTMIASVSAEVIGGLVFLLAPRLIGIFSRTPEVIAYGVRQCRVEALFFILLGFANSCAAILRGAGHSMPPMIIMLSVWCVFRILFITVMVRLIPDIAVVFSAYPVTWGISCVLFVRVLRRMNWTENDGLAAF